MKKHSQSRIQSPKLELLEPRRLFASGDLDVALNNDHLVTTAFSAGGAQVNDIATLADGSMIAVGQLQTKKGAIEAAVAEYNFDGSLNTAFGTAGTVVGLPGKITEPDHLRIGSDGSIYILDATLASMTKLTPAGAIDTTFGDNGVIKFPEIQSVTGFSLDSQNNILIAGTQNTTGQTLDTSDGDLRRYTSNGLIDSTFHGGVDIDLPPIGTSTGAQYRTLTFSAPTIDAAGNVLVIAQDALHSDHTTGDIDITNNYLYRFTATGAIDRTFGSRGNTALSDDSASIAGIDGSGRILIDSNDQLVRYTSAGALDTTYANNGTTSVDVSNADRISDGSMFAVAPDGTVTALVASPTPDTNFDIVHILSTGAIDTDFGNNGTVSPSALGASYANALTLAPDGTAVIGGQVGALSPSGKVDTRTFAIGRLYTTKGPAIQLVPRTLKSKSRYLSMTVEIRDNEGVELSTLDNNDLKLFDSDGNTRKIRFLSDTDVRSDGLYLLATYRVVAPNNQSTWLPSDNGTYQVRLQKQQITDNDLNPTESEILGTLNVKIA